MPQELTVWMGDRQLKPPRVQGAGTALFDRGCSAWVSSSCPGLALPLRKRGGMGFECEVRMCLWPYTADLVGL